MDAADNHTNPSISTRRRILGLAALGLVLPPALGLPRLMASSRIAHPSLLDNPPLCHVADTESGPADPAGPPPHIRFAYNATGICTAAVPVALRRGFFRNHNLDVEFVQLAGSTDQMITALATDKADAGVGMELSWLKPLEQGLDVRLTTALHGGCTRLLARKDGGPKSIADLRGKTIGVSSIAGTPRNFFAVLLAKAGIDPDSGVQWREYPADLLGPAVTKGEVDAAADADPAIWMTRARSNGSLVEIASNLTGDYANRSCCVLGIRSKLVQQSPATAAALTRALREGADYVAAHPDDAAQIFYEYTPKAPVSELAAMLRSHTHMHHPAGANLRGEVAATVADLRQAGVIRASTDPAAFAAHFVVDVLA